MKSDKTNALQRFEPECFLRRHFLKDFIMLSLVLQLLIVQRSERINMVSKANVCSIYIYLSQVPYPTRTLVIVDFHPFLSFVSFKMSFCLAPVHLLMLPMYVHLCLPLILFPLIFPLMLNHSQLKSSLSLLAFLEETSYSLFDLYVKC